MLTFSQWILRLTKGYFKATGKQPDGLAKLKIRLEAAEKVREQEKVIQFPKDRITDWWKSRPGDKTPIKKETTLDDMLKGKSHIDERGREWTFKKRTEGEVVPIQKGISDEAATGHVQKLKEDLPSMSLKELHQLRADVINRKAYGSFNDAQRRELLDVLTNQFTNKSGFAAGGLAGQLHLNRQGYLFGGPAAGSKALKAIMNAIRENKKWGVGGPPYKPEKTAFNVKDITKRLYGMEMSLADIKKMSEAPFSAGINKFNFPEFSKGWKDLKAKVIKNKLNESKMKAEAMIEAAKHVPADNATAKQMKAQFTRSGKEQLKEAKEGLKEIDIYIDMLAKKGRKLHAAGGLAQVLGV